MATRRMHEIRRVTALTYFQAYALTQRKNYRAGPQRRWSYVAAGRRRHPYTSVEEHADTQARINTRSTASWLCLDTTGAVPANQPVSGDEATDRFKSFRRKMADCPS